MGLIGRATVRRPTLRSVRDRIDPYAKQSNLTYPARDLIAKTERWGFFEGSPGAPVTDMTWNYNRVTTGSKTFSRRAYVIGASIAVSWDSAPGGYRYQVAIEMDRDAVAFDDPVLALACVAAGDNSGSSQVAMPLGIIVEAGTTVFWSYRRRITNAAYWVQGELLYVELPLD